MSSVGADSFAIRRPTAVGANEQRPSAGGRSPFGRWLATGLLIASAAFLGGCAKPRAVTATTALRISQRNEPADLDPATASLPDEFFVIRALAEGLFVPNPDGGTPLPAAADHYDVSADGLRYTFHLREGARWSNGEPVTADDFIASFRRVLTPATAAPKAHLFYSVRNARAFATSELSDFTRVGFRSPDANTLVVELAHPTANFPLYVASGAWIPVNPRVVEKFGRKWTDPAHYVGNGPFVLAEWRSQQRIVVRRNEHYRNSDSARVDAIEFVRFDNQESEELAFRAGQIDVTLAVPQTKLDVYARDRPDELHRSPLAETRFIAFNPTRAPLNDVRVRRALSLAIDRQKIVERVLRGGQLPAARFLSPALLGAADRPDRDPPAASHDPVEARRLLAEAGYPNGAGFPRLELSCWVRNPVLEAVQQMWRQELGINATLAIQEAKVFLSALHAGNYDVGVVTNLLDVRDPVSALADFTTDAPNNFPHWHSSEYDRLIDTAESAASADLTLKSTMAAERLLLADVAVAPLYFNTQNWLMSPRVHGWQQDALWARRYNEVSVDPR